MFPLIHGVVSQAPPLELDPVAAYRKFLMDLGPKAFYRMADAGTTMLDETGVHNGVHDVTNLISAPIPTAAGAHNYNGSTDSSFTSTAALRSPSFTCAAWVIIPSTSPAAGMSIVNAFNGSWTHGYQMWVSDARMPLFYRGNGSGYANFAPITEIPLDQPVRFVITHDANTGRSYAWINATTNLPDGVSYSYQPPTSSDTWEIGSEDGGARLTGLAWDIVFYDYPWTAQTVADDYALATT